MVSATQATTCEMIYKHDYKLFIKDMIYDKCLLNWCFKLLLWFEWFNDECQGKVSMFSPSMNIPWDLLYTCG